MLVLAVPASAAGGPVAPPGNSGIAQYLEVTPGAEGPTAPNGDGHALRAATRRQLEARGATGRALARFADATAPADRPATSSTTRAGVEPDGDSPIAGTATALFATSDAGGVGLLLPLVLIVSTAVLSLLALRRRRGA